MKLVPFLAAAALCLFIASPALAEEQCKVASKDAQGRLLFTDISLDLAGGAELDPAALPERPYGVMCRRPSIVPLPGDERVLIEWGLSFGIVEDGPRALWIWARAGTLQFKIDDGKLNGREKAALKRWREAAQLRYRAALAKGARQPN